MAWALVIEDDAANRETVRLLLEDAGFDVREAADGETGLALLYDAPEPSVVLLDRLLPALGSEGMLGVVAADPRLLRHRYLLVTASPERLTPIEREMLAELDVPVIGKPYEVEALLCAVAHARERLAAGAGESG